MRLIFALAVIPREKLRLILKSSGIKELKICSKNKLIVITVMVSQKNMRKPQHAVHKYILPCLLQNNNSNNNNNNNNNLIISVTNAFFV